MHHLLVLIRIHWSLLLHNHSLLHHLLLLLDHHDLLSMLSESHFLLFVNELEKLFASHGKNLVESAKHETLEVLVWDAQNGRTVRLDLLMELVAAIENEFMLLLLLVTKESRLEALLWRLLYQLLSHLCLHILWHCSSLGIKDPRGTRAGLVVFGVF